MPAKAFQYKIDVFGQEAIGQLHLRNGYAFHTECLFALCTGKMHVQVAQRAGTVAPAYGVFHRAGTVVDAMDKHLPVEKGNSAKQCGFVYRLQFVLQIRQTKGLRISQHSPEHQQTDSRRLYAPCLQPFRIICFHSKIDVRVVNDYCKPSVSTPSFTFFTKPWSTAPGPSSVK